MMKKFLPMVCICWFAAIAAYAGELTINPGTPAPGNRITIKYKAEPKFRGLGTVYAIVYSFKETSLKPEAHQAELTFQKDVQAYVGDYKLAPSTVFGMVKISDGIKRYDDNDGQLWDFMVAGAGGKPVRSANYRAAISYYGTMPAGVNRTVNIDQVLTLLDKELALYPENFQAKVAYNSIRYDQKKIDSVVYYNRIQSLLGEDIDRSVESFVLSAVRTYAAAGQPEKGEELRKQFIAENPQSGLAEEQAVQELSSLIKDQEKFPPAAGEFLRRFPTNEYSEQIQLAAITHLLNAHKAEESEQFLNGIGAYAAPMAWNQLARVYMAADSTLDKAKEMGEHAVAQARTPNPELKPQHLAEFEWKKQQTDVVLGVVLDTYGVILGKQNDNDGAIRAFEEMLYLLEKQALAEQYEHGLQAYLNAGRLKDAYALASTAVAVEQANDFIRGEHRHLFDELMSKRKGEAGHSYDDELARLEERGRAFRLEKISSERLNMAAIEGELTTLDGKKVALSDFHGKVVIIDFWATWCGPCKKSMPALQDVYDMYADNDKVQVLVVNAWERVEDRQKVASQFISSAKYTFPVYLDLKDEVIRKFGVTGIPTKFYLDKNGKIQYKEVGFTTAEEFKKYASSVIGLLLSDGFYKEQ